MIECPYCNSAVGNEFLNEHCPFCNEYVRSTEWIDEIVSARIRHLRRNNKYDSVKSLILKDSTKEALRIIRELSGKNDEVIEKVLIKRISSDNSLDKKDSGTKTITQVHSNQKGMLIVCSVCENKISNKAEVCPHCGNPTGVHVCPRCSSVNTKVITGMSKATSIFLWGAFAANKVVSKFECKDCGHRF